MSGLPISLTLEKFATWLSDKVEIHFTVEDIRSAQIVEVKAMGEKIDGFRKPFSVLLLTDLVEAYYEQGTFKVVCPDQSEEYLFMVPIGVESESGRMRYELVFN